jgi:hypothetical protein
VVNDIELADCPALIKNMTDALNMPVGLIGWQLVGCLKRG